MMKLQTQLSLSPQQPQIDYQSKLLLLGSCFTENIGKKLEYFKFQNYQNPFGVIFNPISVEKLVHRALNGTYFTEEDIFEQNQLWHCFEIHSSLSGIDKNDFLEHINLQLSQFKTQLTEVSHCIITLGSSWVYRHIKNDKIVANCHKIPQKAFSKEMLSVETISESLKNIVSEIQQVNPRVTFIFTVSPVRHIKDGFEENTLSKAHLISGLHYFINQQSTIHKPQCFYFPSFELMMDELRDYRFYKEDMLHPNQTAIQYIWDRFLLVWISKETNPLQKEIDTIQKGLQHRSNNPESKVHLAFMNNLQQKMNQLSKAHPHISF